MIILIIIDYHVSNIIKCYDETTQWKSTEKQQHKYLIHKHIDTTQNIVVNLNINEPDGSTWKRKYNIIQYANEE